MPVFYGLGATEKREILVCVLHILRYLDDASLVKAWQQNMARTRLFFKLLEECQELLEVSFHFPIQVSSYKHQGQLAIYIYHVYSR
jgi:hypothetical protein